MRHILFLAFLVFGMICPNQAQEIKTSVSAQTLFSTNSDIPFWMSSNQNGIFDRGNSSFQLMALKAERCYNKDSKNKIDYIAGANAFAIKGNIKVFQLNQWFAGLKYAFLNLKVGAFPNRTIYGGLSSTNGDLHWSNNTRPMPRLRISTNDYVPLWFLPTWFSVSTLYEEGLLNDDRYVRHSHLHHKNLHFRFRLKPDVFFMVGIDHYVMWGGDHPTLGHLPDNLDAYIRYVLGLPGNKDFTRSDQNLMAGNQMGKYRLRLQKKVRKGNLIIYLDHPFDDRMDLANYKDNMLGIYFEKNEQKGVVKIIYELMYTNDQRVDKNNVDDNGNYIIRGYESFFIHGTYKSGLSYRNRMIATPFSTPIAFVEGINLGSGNNRIVLNHFGMEVYMIPELKIRSLLSYSFNYGTYLKVYDQIEPGYFDDGRHQFSSMVELNYKLSKIKSNLLLGFAYDYGRMYETRFGLMIGIKKNLL